MALQELVRGWGIEPPRLLLAHATAFAHSVADMDTPCPPQNLCTHTRLAFFHVVPSFGAIEYVNDAI